ncbi:PDZ domain-containing protein [Lacticaseibacillus daqingensis]|uniref:PDZ domain-containing protein n=1 Tax=Lacticaseibacillus daqingensis TaxID=2486014 RepID=UPI000F79E4D0|nr:PDZ domain-containing protein [Lacticaseibacillus daqingensis]
MRFLLIGGFGVPVLAGLVALFWRWRRFGRERAMFGIAIDRHWTGWWAGLLGGLATGILVSGIAWGLDLRLPLPVALLLEGLVAVGLLTSGLGFSPAWLGVSGVLAVTLVPQLTAVPPVGQWGWHLVALIALLWAAQAGLLRFLNPPIDVPRVRDGVRGARIATYTRRQFYCVPLVLPLSGVAWPWALVPLVLGVAVTTRKQLPTAATDAWAKQSAWAAALAVGLAGLLWWRPTTALGGLIALALVSLGLAWMQHRAAGAGATFISQTTSGVRLVAIQPDTPASKMALQAGDILLTCNHLPVASEADLYAAMQTQPTYCRLKVQRLDGAIKMTETAIFNGAPHELGMITFAEDDHEEDLSR